MQRALLVCGMLPLLLCGAEQRRKTTPSRQWKQEGAAPKAQAQDRGAERRPAAPKLVVPSDAVRIDANTWRHTDQEGRTWNYVQSPFGLTRYEVASQSGTPVADTPADMQSFDAGDSVRFERPSPFGVVKWTRKKTELTALERRVWERDSQPAPAASAPAADKGKK